MYVGSGVFLTARDKRCSDRIASSRRRNCRVLPTDVVKTKADRKGAESLRLHSKESSAEQPLSLPQTQAVASPSHYRVPPLLRRLARDKRMCAAAG